MMTRKSTRPAKRAESKHDQSSQSDFFSNKYGYFDAAAREFVITRPDTPAPWVNYMTNGRYTGLISHTGGGYSFYNSPRDSRITRWRYNSLPKDHPGRYLYFRDSRDGHFWSPTWQPTTRPLDSYRCRHGMNHTIIESEYRSIKVAITYFVAQEDVEIWNVTVKNKGKSAAHLSVFPYVELCLGHALVDLINQPNDQHFNDVRYLKDRQMLLATKRYWVTFTSATVKQANQAWDRWVFFATSLAVSGFDGLRDGFIGRWRSEENPIAVERDVMGNSEITAGDACAALRCELHLEPGEERTFTVMLGVVGCGSPEKDAAALVQKYRAEDNVDAELRRVVADMHDYLSAFQTDLPDKEMQLMMNCWNQYQGRATFLFSRNASYYHGGLLFGRGYRDSCQDLISVLPTQPHWARERLLESASKQFRNGSVYHCYFPLSGGGERTGHSDTPLWLPLAVTAYLKETGDFEILKQGVPFEDGGNATLLDHARMALDYVLSQLSPRHLALFGPGDWNDTLDYLGRGGKGETVWGSMFLCYVLREFVYLLDHIESLDASHYRLWYEKVKAAINTHCWDGAWYIRGTNDLGDVIGSAKCEEGKIFLNVQSWAVLSGVAESERALAAMNSVAKHLATPKGPKILHPAYTKVNPNIGLATRCVPGKKENGAVFNHPVSWAILAELVLGRPENAYEYYRQALPMNPVIDIDRYEVEPYVYAEYVTSPDHPTFGQASHSWLTGSATWMFYGCSSYLLGVRATYEGLLVDPRIPKEWKSYRVVRRFRGAMYDIEVRNPQHVSSGVKEIVLDNQPLSSNLLPALADGKVHAVTVILGDAIH
jgi:cellobiose phosphorylase